MTEVEYRCISGSAEGGALKYRMSFPQFCEKRYEEINRIYRSIAEGCEKYCLGELAAALPCEEGEKCFYFLKCRASELCEGRVRITLRVLLQANGDEGGRVLFEKNLEDIWDLEGQMILKPSAVKEINKDKKGKKRRRKTKKMTKNMAKR